MKFDDDNARANANEYQRRDNGVVRGAGTVMFGYPCLVFGKDDYAHDSRARLEVALLRTELRRHGMPVLGFGLSDDGHTWLMIVDTADEYTVRYALDFAYRTAFLQDEAGDAGI